MIGALVFLLIILVILAIFIGKNVHHTCSMWLFHEFSDLSTVSVIMIAFAAGIVFTMLCFFISYLIKKDKKSLAGKEKTDEKTKSASTFAGLSGSRAAGSNASGTMGRAGVQKKTFFKFGRSKKNADVNKSSENSDIAGSDSL